MSIKLFISQPMRYLSNEQIIADRQKAFEDALKLFPEDQRKDVELVDNLRLDCGDEHALSCLGKDFVFLSTADVAYFADEWQKRRGCRMEHQACIEYGIKIIRD